MSLTTSFTQTTVYFAPSVAPNVTPATVTANISNLGTSQGIQLNATAATVIGDEISIPIQVAVPPPLLYFATSNAADVLTIQSPDGLLITVNPNTPGTGFNGQNFQPSAGGRYTVYFTNGVARAAGASLFLMQAVLENTIGQFINMSSISFSYDVERKPTVTQAVAMNTTSAVPNQLNIDFDRFPVKKGIQAMAIFRVTVSCSGVESFGKDSLSVYGSATRNVQLIAGQNYSVIWNSQVDGYFSGRYSVTISQSGNLTLPSTCAAFSAGDMFPALLSNSPDVYTQAAIENAEDADSLANTIKNLMRKVEDRDVYSKLDNSSAYNELSLKVSVIEKLFEGFAKKNEEVHRRQLDHLDTITSLVSNLRMSDRQSERG